MILIREPKVFFLPKDFDKNFKYYINVMIKRSKFLAEHKINNEMDQLLSKSKHGNNIHEC